MLEWAGANNPLWIVYDNELTILSPDKQPIGRYEKTFPFTNNTVHLKSGTILYLFTDGFADQFGGTNRPKKVTRKRFKELLIGIHNFDMAGQKKELDRFIKSFKNDVEQIDDILVIGVKV